MIKDDMLALLVCPLGRAPLRLEGESLVCTRCGLRYAIHDDIPNMLYEEAELPPGVKSIADLACSRTADVAKA
ncbi:Trm112 family protein [Paludisphaera mucosa]|uniref:Trm112 family protein n=1 Tax=Paludisphaera mucosa TaxID=3030827 RepID=A0ABT6F4B1_9BACT|nr:Trm112 family protein [Paludisphaera mucosa]MDG3002354.1 Trm112 family protein [Paludisphaera mucosa]